MFVLEHTETLVLFITIRNKIDIFRIRHNGMLILPESTVRPLETFSDCAYRIKENYLIDKKLHRLDRFTCIHKAYTHGERDMFSFVYVQDFDDDCVIKNPNKGEWTFYQEILNRHEYSPLTYEVLTLLLHEHRLL